MNYRECAIRYLNTGAKSIKQVSDYLAKREATDEDISQTISFLQELGYLDDVRFSAAVFLREYEKGRGKKRIEQYLKTKGVGSDQIQQGYYQFLDEHEDEFDESEMALKEGRKLAEGKELDEKLKGKIARRLVTKGFSTSIVYKVLGQLVKEKE